MQRLTRRAIAAAAAGALALGGAAGCRDFLDVNTNPNGPQSVTANLYLAPMLHWMVTTPQFDGRYIGMYTQQWMTTATAFNPGQTFGRMGYDANSDNGGEAWRTTYFVLGQNLIDMTARAEAEQRWDLLGVAQLIKAWGWQTATDASGEIILSEAYRPNTFSFAYDTQEAAYTEIQRLLNEAIKNLQRTDGAVDAGYLGRTDRMYNGDRTKWLKLAYGMLALNLNHYSNKASYNPDSVVKLVDLSFAGNVDDALLGFTGVSTDNSDLSFLGRTRNNVTLYRQTQFVVNLMNGTHFGGAVDPRMSRMLAPSADGVYRGLDVNTLGTGGLAAALQPRNFFGYADAGGLQQPGRYVFSDKARLPVLTYAQLQFIKAEAALRKGDRATALAAYRNGVSAHIDFVNERNRDDNQSPTQITAAEKAAYLASPAVVPSAADLSLTQVMSQKYIAQWAWGHYELWMDMRRYNYTDVDPATRRPVYPGFAPPTTLFADNAGKLVERLRPRFNSEYVWNRAGLQTIGGLAADYHTKPLWITEP
jgi:hypothetical protein